MALDPVGVTPAPLKKRRFVDAAVIRAGEAKILGERVFNGLAVVRHIGGKESADDLCPAALGHRVVSRYVAGS